MRESELHKHARKTVEGKGKGVARVIRVYPDAILYVVQAGKQQMPMTCWLRGKEAFFEPGFEPLPPEYAFPKG